MVFLLGALCYIICTMKAPPQALEGPVEEPHGINFTISWHLQKPPLQALPGPGEEASWYSCFVICAIQYDYEGSSPGPSRAWGGAFIIMAFKLAKVK